MKAFVKNSQGQFIYHGNHFEYVDTEEQATKFELNVAVEIARTKTLVSHLSYSVVTVADPC